MNFWKSLLKLKKIRRSIITHLKSDYFHEFEHCIPLQNGYEAYLLEYDSYDSFSEIFIQREYEQFIPDTNIRKILDIGANYGYFSLWLQSRKPENEIYSIMIEPSPRCQRSLDRIVSFKKLNDRFKLLHRVIANPNLGGIDFYDRPFMASSVFGSTKGENSSQVKVLTQSDITKLLPPPFDLIKCDIEGSEWDLLIHYPNILMQTKYLVLEWHDWHNGGGGLSQLVSKLGKLKYNVIKIAKPSNAVGREGKVGLILAKNLNFPIK